MHSAEIKPDLLKILQKISKKDKVLYEQILKKIDEICQSFDVDHYKNLRSPLNEFKRVHVKNSFVLIFKYITIDKRVIFYYFDHHDCVYQWQPNPQE